MSQNRIRRPQLAVPRGGAQLGFGFGVEKPPEAKVPGSPRFKQGHPDALFVGSMHLSEYLQRSGLGHVLEMKNLLEQVDLSSFTERYASRGRAPYHPRVLLGLVLYGVQQGVSSLRGLEQLARRDVGAWWVCEGLQPDHSTLGRFLVQHDDLITDEFFTNLVRAAMETLKVSTNEAVIDGTVIEAASSHRKTLRGEALRKYAHEAKEAAEANASDPQAQRRAAEAEAAVEVADERDAARAQKKRVGKGTQVVPHEPEAAVQRQKDGTTRPSYKATMSVSGGLVTGVHVDPTSETAAVEPLVEQHRKSTGEMPQTTLMDAGFFSTFVLAFFVARDLDVLCPPGQAFDASSMERRRRSPNTKFLKSDFRYDEDSDVYICPAERLLKPEHRSSDRNGPYQRYQGTQCSDCPLKAQCTDAQARTIKRYEADEYKDAMREVLRQPQALARYQGRSVGERPFAEVKTRQGFTRFRRRGVRGARLEAALHFAAFNLRVAAGQLAVLRLEIQARSLRESQDTACSGSYGEWFTAASITIVIGWSG